MIVNLVTDRAESDKAYAAYLLSKNWGEYTSAEKGLYNAGLKGSYTSIDMNRVGTACEYLHNLFTSLGYDVSGYVTLRTNWQDGEIPNENDWNTYLSSVSSLKSVFSAEQELPSTMRHLTVDDANNIEKLLLEVESQLQRLSAIFARSGAWNAVAGLTIYAAN